jgi:glutamate-1-semialdehyde aminotransferase
MDKTSGRQRPGRGQALYARAKQIIPGGTQLLSKRPEMLLPGQWPCYFETARGAEVTDLDGRTYMGTLILTLTRRFTAPWSLG